MADKWLGCIKNHLHPDSLLEDWLGHLNDSSENKKEVIVEPQGYKILGEMNWFQPGTGVEATSQILFREM